MKEKRDIVKLLLIFVLITVIVTEFLFLSLFYDLDFAYTVYQPAPEFHFSTSLPLYKSPVVLTVLKHECFLARVEVHILPGIVLPGIYSEVRLSFFNGSIINLTGSSEYVFTILLPGEFHRAGYVTMSYRNNYSISMDEPIKVVLEEIPEFLKEIAEEAIIDRPEGELNFFNLAVITVVSGFAEIRVKVWGVVL
ncbi:MAG: hypothetical protein QXF52_09995 [Thermoproteota archaeon]